MASVQRVPVRVERVQRFEDRMALMRLLNRLFSADRRMARPYTLGRSVSALSLGDGFKNGFAVLAYVYQTPVGFLYWQSGGGGTFQPHWGYVLPSFRGTDIGERLHAKSRRLLHAAGFEAGAPTESSFGLETLSETDLNPSAGTTSLTVGAEGINARDLAGAA